MKLAGYLGTKMASRWSVWDFPIAEMQFKAE